MSLQWVQELKHHCPKTPILLVDLQIEKRDDAAVIKKLSKFNLKPLTFEAGEMLAMELKLHMYVECSALTRKGLKNVFDEAILAALEPPEPVRKKRFNFSLHVPAGVKKVFRRKKPAAEVI